MSKLEMKTALVTGASKGIGAGIALALASAGASVWAKVAATLEGVPIKVLSAYGPHETLEGQEVEGVVIAEFPSAEAARKWYDGPAYQEAATHRQRGAIYRGLIVEGT